MVVINSTTRKKKRYERRTCSIITGKFSLTLYDALENYVNRSFYRYYISNLSLLLAIHLLDKSFALRNFYKIYIFFFFSFPVYSILQQHYDSSVD